MNENQEGISLNLARLDLHWKDPWQGSPAPHLLRGAIASAFPDNDFFHQHAHDGKEIYRYPRIQYRWREGEGVIIGFGSAVEPLGQLFMNDLELRLGDRCVVVAEAKITFTRSSIGISPRLMRYRFVSPWLPFNQENFEKYNCISRDQQRYELDRIAVGNILSALKGLDIFIGSTVYAAIMPGKHRWCKHKNNQLAGFGGTLITNVTLPNDFAIGKAVSHGYGWIRRENGDHNSV
jgi:hypothetical protein